MRIFEKFYRFQKDKEADKNKLDACRKKNKADLKRLSYCFQCYAWIYYIETSRPKITHSMFLDHCHIAVKFNK